MEKEFLEFIEQNQGVLHKICAVYAVSTEDKNDLIQEMLFQLWKAYPTYDINRQVKFSTWLYRVALNTALNFKRKTAINFAVIEATELDIPDKETATEKEENKRLLYHCIQQLPEIDRALILLHLEGHSYAEISLVTGFTESNIGVKLNRIKKKLQTLFKLTGK